MEQSPLSPRSASGGGRVYWMDAARALAIISISINHAINHSLLMDENALFGSRLYAFLTALFYVISRFGVPIFLMLSGALLLGRDYSCAAIRKRFYRHNWGRLLLVTVLWLGIRYWFFLLLDGSSSASLKTTLIRFFKTLVMMNGENLGCMWYMPMILCVYPLIPILSAAVQRLPGRVFLLPCATVLLVSFLIPNVNTALTAIGTGFRIRTALKAEYLMPLYLLYLVGGWYLSRGAAERISTALLAAVFLLSTLGTAFFQFWMYRTHVIYSVRYADIGVLLAAFSLFEMIRRRARPGRLPERPVRSLALCSLGVYFVHHLIMASLEALFEVRLPQLQDFPLFAVLELAGLLGGWLVVLLTARIPFVGSCLYLIRRPKVQPETGDGANTPA